MGIGETGRGKNGLVIEEVRLVVRGVNERLGGLGVAVDDESKIGVRIDFVVRDDVEQVDGSTSEGDVRVQSIVGCDPKIVMPRVIVRLASIGLQ